MGYLQTTTGVTTTGPGATLSFTTPICAQVSLQVSSTYPPPSVNLEWSLDGINFEQVSLSGGSILSNNQSFKPVAAIRYNVASISHAADIAIAAAPWGSE